MYVVKCWIQTWSFSWPHFSEVKNLLLMTQFVLSFILCIRHDHLKLRHYYILLLCRGYQHDQRGFNNAAELVLIAAIDYNTKFYVVALVWVMNFIIYKISLRVSFKVYESIFHPQEPTYVWRNMLSTSYTKSVHLI